METTIRIIYPDWTKIRKLADEARGDGGEDPYMDVTMRGKDHQWWMPKDMYEDIWSREFPFVQKEDDPTILGELFEQFNIGDHGGTRCRSMSVGDIVVIDDRRYVCKPIGWERSDVG